MKMNKVLPLSLAAALTVTVAACNVNGLNKTGAPAETTTETALKPNTGKANPTTGAGGNVSTNPNVVTAGFAKPNATVKGQLLDSAGKPIADAIVFTGNGQAVKTDAQGNYAIPVTAENGKDVVLVYQKNGYVFSSQKVTMNPGQTAIVDASVKQLDNKVVSINNATGGTFANSTGVLEVDVPKGVLTGDTAQMTMTPLAFGANGTANELPGALETVDEKGQQLLLMPAEYWSIDLTGATLKEGESITMRMKLPKNDTAPVQLKAGDMIPCYIYDAKLGYWNSPNLGPIVEKDGELWATYEIKASALTNRADVAKAVQMYYGSPDHPLTEEQLIANRDEIAAQSGNSLGGGYAGGGAIGGHTYYNLFGTTMTGLVKDEKGNALNGASVSIRGTSRDANITSGADGTPGHYASLQYRAQSARVTATLNQYCSASQNVNTAPSNLGPLTPNQFGYRPNGQMEQMEPRTAAWPTLTVDTRHPAEITFTGGTASRVQAASVHYKLNGNAVTYAQLTAKNLDRNVRYTLEADSGSVDNGAGATTFTVPSNYTPGKPFPVSIELKLDAGAVK